MPLIISLFLVKLACSPAIGPCVCLTQYSMYGIFIAVGLQASRHACIPGSISGQSPFSSTRSLNTPDCSLIWMNYSVHVDESVRVTHPVLIHLLSTPFNLLSLSIKLPSQLAHLL